MPPRTGDRAAGAGRPQRGRFRALLPKLNISNDFFIRTTDPQHEARVQEVMQRIYDNGYVYMGLYEGWYCPRCADFKVENEILDGNRCPIHEIELTRESEENYFFKLSAFQEQLARLFDEQPDFVMPPRALNEAKAFVEQGLRDVSLSRAKLTWGVKVPWDPSHVFYVWFDADLNYYTALSYARPGEDLTDRYWPAQLHVIGKDIVKFHAIYWPAMLLAADLALPEHVFAHGFLMAQDGRKMSKSLGNVLDPFTVIDEFGTDALRFYLMREVQFGQDGNVGVDGVRGRYDTELANDYGNLASRTVAMIARYADGIVPQSAIDPELAAEFDNLAPEVAERFDRFEVTQALELIWQRVRRLNRYVEEQKPWELARDPSAAARLEMVLSSLHQGLRAVTVELEPYMPEASATVLEGLDAKPLQPIPPLFPKRDR